MRRVGGGSIVNISSVHGVLVSDSAAVYDTCKHAVIGLTRGMAVDFGPDGVRANAICPGLIVTEVRDDSWQEAKEDALFAEMYHPLRRVGRPRDIAAGVGFLVSDEAAFITGHTLTVDGGLSIQLQDSLVRRARQYAQPGQTVRSLRTPPA
jgi:NAD(P)-dependent dehydrogenase (short-subunit alcohol dehydrogenase family)